MTAREEILTRLKEQERSSDAPAPWRSRRNYDDLTGQFGLAVTAAKGEFFQAANFDEALEQTGNLLVELEVKSALVNDQAPLNEVDLAGRWPLIDWYVVGQQEGDLRAFAATASVGISVGEAALAETGSVLVSSGPGRSRLTSLLPPVHLALVPSSCLTADIFTWAAGGLDLSPASLTFISGPSKTGDIEQTMATGVHGPGRFAVFLFNDGDG